MSGDLWPEEMAKAAYARKAKLATPDPSAKWINQLLHDMFVVKRHNNGSLSYHMQYAKAVAQIQKRLTEVEVTARLDELNNLPLKHGGLSPLISQGFWEVFGLERRELKARIDELTQQRDSGRGDAKN